MSLPRDGKEEDLCEYLPNDPEDTPLFRCLRSEMKELLARAIAELPEKSGRCWPFTISKNSP